MKEEKCRHISCLFLLSDYALERPELSRTSVEAKDFISRLLVTEPEKRLTADQCLQHRWLVDDKLYLGILETLETSWMRRCLARRRWYRLFNAVRVMNSIRLLSTTTSNASWDSSASSSLTGDLSTEEEEDDDLVSLPTTEESLLPRADLRVHDLSAYNDTFEEQNLMVNCGSLGIVFCVKHTATGEVYAAKHRRNCLAASRREASVLRAVRNDANVAAFFALYESRPRHLSVIVSEFLVGGDLVERAAASDFVLNEAKVKSLMRQVCSGLAHVHDSRVLHLDLKPFSVVFCTREDDALLKVSAK
jgi:serine/threonine protein kinase